MIISTEMKKKFIAVENPRFRDIFKWRYERLFKKKDFSFSVPHIEQVDHTFLQENRTEASITWNGHVTFLIQLGGINIMTDPVWAMQMGFERRLSEPGLQLSELPEIDVVLISHSHFDHLHYPSIKKLPGHPVYFVPKGLKKQLEKKGLTRVEELSWWESIDYEGIKFTFIPSRHWTRRTLTDLNQSLWGGWMLEGCEKTLYFVGDTGYHDEFNEIANKFSIDYVMMPIGSYEPEWFMNSQHITPEEAVNIYLELGANYFIPMHYDAFRLADDTPREALDRLNESWERANIEQEKLKILKLGETIRLGK